MIHESTASITGKREKKQEKEGWRERKMEILFWFSSLTFFFYLSHLDVASAHGFILHVDYYFLACQFFFFFLEKVLVVCFNKDGDFVLVYLIHLISFFLFDEIIFISFRCSFSAWVHLACGLLFSFLLFFLEKVLLICFNLLYVVMFLFLAQLYVVMLKLLCCMLLLKRSVPLFGIFIISSRGFPYLFFFSFFFGYM